MTEADLVLDHAIYSKALEILMNPVNEELRKFVVIRMGGFHTKCISLAVIGKRFKDAGLKDLVVESDILGKSSIDRALAGKEYNYAMRVHKAIYAALWRIKIDTIEGYVYNEHSQVNVLSTFLESHELKALIENPSHENLTNCREVFSPMLQLIEDFDKTIKDTVTYGPTAAFWQSYLETVQTLLDFHKSIRVGNWDLHLQSMQRMLVWFFAYDRPNYSRHLSYCWSSFLNLHNTYPKLHQEFKKGNFAIRRVHGKFNKLPPDQVIEQTINREQKGSGGIKGFSTTEGTVQHWILSSHAISAINADLRETYLTRSHDESKPKDLGKSRIAFDEEKVQKCYETIGTWKNPFKESDNLNGLASGVAAPEEIVEDLLSASSKGKVQFEDFVAKRIETNEIPFYDPIKKLKLKTFTSLQEVKKVKVNGQSFAIKSDRQTFPGCYWCNQSVALTSRKS